jgi:hypothetical protein
MKVAKKKKWIDRFGQLFEAYARAGLDEAKTRGAKRYHVWWAGMPYFARGFNLCRHIDGEPWNSEGEDALDLPAFPFRAIKQLPHKPKAFFENEDGTLLDDPDDGWDAAFDCGPYIEAGEWVKLAVDARILAVAKTLGAERGKVKLVVAGDGGEAAETPAHWRKEIAALRKEREYAAPPAAVIKKFLGVLTDEIDPTWIK